MAPSLLRLPRELRDEIYHYLIPHESLSHPLRAVGITSVSHKPPALALLLIHPTVAAELLDYYYTISTWKLVFSHAFNFFRVDPELRNLEQSPILRRIRKVEVVFFYDILLLREYPSFGLEKFCAEIEKTASRACDVLCLAPNLRSVTVSWVDTTTTGSLADKSRILAPLRRLSEHALERHGQPLVFKIGEINGPADADRQNFIQVTQEILGTRQILETGLSKPSDHEPSKYRMLAFDVRQERHPDAP